MLKRILLTISENDWCKKNLPEYGFVKGTVSKFFPGIRLEDTIKATKELVFKKKNSGTYVTYLGENISNKEEANENLNIYKNVIEESVKNDIPLDISIKPTQLGLDQDLDFCIDNMKELVSFSKDNNRFVWIDMEYSRYVSDTIKMYEEIRKTYSKNIGICLQSYLHRTENDIQSIINNKGKNCFNIRLVKGAYKESPEISITDPNENKKNYIHLSNTILTSFVSNNDKESKLVLGSHDHYMVETIINNHDSSLYQNHNQFEINTLYGINEQLLSHLQTRYNVSVKTLICFGENYFPWFVRRIAENPNQNLGLLFKNLF
eukprot:TRINITY_DN13118_c0_g1_i1.p1 TRINITY_DN13118_c0_g1~~TRINITY_DN13118_c0_g1_i1.p1  ORF type:complete len:319 (+),score=59.38 TRINITY_DN13118_c0_g1_i1:87-1043(+)